jgi:hypothetical protein
LPGEVAAGEYRGWLESWFANDVARLAQHYRQLGIESFSVARPARQHSFPPSIQAPRSSLLPAEQVWTRREPR